MAFVLNLPLQLVVRLFISLERVFLHVTHPSRYASRLLLSIAADLIRSKAELIAENVLLRQQLIILHRQVEKPSFTQSDRQWFILLASRIQHWKETLLIFKPDTLIRWHRQGFRLFWKFKSRKGVGRPKLSGETIALIQQMTKDNLLWGAKRIQGELLKLGIQAATATI